jgi:transcriptional regulator with XRE-family HTH domain
MAKPKKPLPPETFAATLRLHRDRLGLSQTELAELLGMTMTVISDWETGRTTPPAITQEGAIARLRLSTTAGSSPIPISGRRMAGASGTPAPRMTIWATAKKNQRVLSGQIEEALDSLRAERQAIEEAAEKKAASG